MAESFDCVTLFFSDITGFTDFTVESTPEEVVRLLHDVYSTMDDVIHKHNVYKVRKTFNVTMIYFNLISSYPEQIQIIIAGI